MKTKFFEMPRIKNLALIVILMGSFVMPKAQALVAVCTESLMTGIWAMAFITVGTGAPSSPKDADAKGFSWGALSFGDKLIMIGLVVLDGEDQQYGELAPLTYAQGKTLGLAPEEVESYINKYNDELPAVNAAAQAAGLQVEQYQKSKENIPVIRAIMNESFKSVSPESQRVFTLLSVYSSEKVGAL